MQVLNIRVELVKKRGAGFDHFCDVELRFSDGAATEPQPKRQHVIDALMEQQPELLERIADQKRGVHFEKISQRTE